MSPLSSSTLPALPSRHSPRTWHQPPTYHLTTDPAAIPLDQLNALFAQHDFSWGQPLPEAQTRQLLNSSICFGLFTQSSSSANPRLIGLGRWITDHVTVVYINDIYILPAFRGQGLAKWMLECMREELHGMAEFLRGAILIVARDSQAEGMYRRVLGMKEVGEGDMLLERTEWGQDGGEMSPRGDGKGVA